MSSGIVNTPKKLNGKIAVIIFSVIAILSVGISGIINLLSDIIRWFEYFELEDMLEDIVPIIVGATNELFTIAAALLMILYVIFIYKKISFKICLSIAFIALAFPVLGTIISALISIVLNFDYIWINIFFAIVDILPRALLPIAAILALLGVGKKIVYIIPIAFFMYLPINSLIEYFWNVGDYFSNYGDAFRYFYLNWNYFLGEPINAIGNLAIGVALIILIAENRPLFVKIAKQEKCIEEMSSQQALTYLKNKLNSGEITTEEYQTQREIIISKL